MTRRQVAALLACWLTALGALAATTAAGLESLGANYWELQPRRHWEDLHIAVGLYTHGLFPASSNAVEKFRDEAGVQRVRERNKDMARTATELRPWEFWRTVTDRYAQRRGLPRVVPRFDDSGRPLLLGLGFRLLGGIAPFLLPWLGFLLAAPLLLWVGFELASAGRPLAAGLLLLLLGGSAYLAGVLRLAYAPTGFYTLAILGLVAVATWAALGVPTTRGLVVRSLLAGAVVALTLLCRGSVGLVAPAFAITLALAGARLGGKRQRDRFLWAGLALLLAALPLVATNWGVARLVRHTLDTVGLRTLPPQRHAVWFGVWTGLGDFDREKGYVWLDQAASRAAVRHGGTPLLPDNYDENNERILRDLVLADVAEDPGWFAGILARRVWATATQQKLWPWPPLGGRSITASTTENEGGIDAYYTLTPHLDVFGFGARTVEAPMALLALPAGLLLLVALVRPSLRPDALALLLVAAGALALPVAITTGSAPETQAFGLVHLLGLALLLDRLAAGRRPRYSSPRVT